MRRPIPARRGSRGLGVVVLLAALAGCSNGALAASDRPAERARPSGSPAAPAHPSPPAARATAPLTGRPVDTATAARPAVAVPVDTDGGDVRGLAAADVVYAELPAGGAPRLLALYQSQDATVGPVGGLRPVDAKLLPVVGGVVAAGYSYGKFVSNAAAAGLDLQSAARQPSAYTGGGSDPFYASTKTLRGLAPKGTAPPPALFPVATDGQPLATIGVHRAATLQVTPAGGASMRWRYDGRQHRWRIRLAGTDVSAANVVVLQVPYTSVLAHYPQGPSIPTAQVYGSGGAYVVADRSAATGSWTHRGPKLLVSVTDQRSFPMRLAPGPTWVLLAPTGSSARSTS